MFTRPAKERLHLELNLFQEQIRDKRESIPTPSNELDCSRAKQAFTKPSTAKEFIDQKGNTGIEYSNQYLLKLQQPLTPGSHAKVQKEQLISPGRGSSLTLVGKYGTSTVESEIEIYQLLASHPKSAQKAILQPLFSENHLYKHILHFPLMPGGNLKKQQTYLFNVLNNSKTKNAATSWLYNQIIALLEALQHLHTENFSTKTKHNKGIVHGDIKLDNILINGLGDLILADFGCAYSAAQPARQLGNISYTAPEIFANDHFTKNPIKDIEKSDNWSLGIALHCLLKNKFPCSNSEFYTHKNQTKSIYLNNGYVFRSKKVFKKIQTLFFKDSLRDVFTEKNGEETFNIPP